MWQHTTQCKSAPPFLGPVHLRSTFAGKSVLERMVRADVSSDGGRGLSLLSTAEVPIILSKLRVTSLHPHPVATSGRAFSVVCFFSSVLNIFSFKTQACPSSDALPGFAAFWLVGTSHQGAAVMGVSTHASPKCNISLVPRNHELQPCLGTGYRDSCCPIGPRE